MYTYMSRFFSPMGVCKRGGGGGGGGLDVLEQLPPLPKTRSPSHLYFLLFVDYSTCIYYTSAYTYESVDVHVYM